jgi:hypothetical protein
VCDENDPWYIGAFDEMKAWREHQKEQERLRGWGGWNGLGFYMLVNGKIKLATDMLEYARWFGDFNNRMIDRTEIQNLPNYPGGDFVSTVFLGIDHNFSPAETWKEHRPVLFESMIFGGKYNERGWRYSSYGEAKQAHWQIVDALRGGEEPNPVFGERPIIELFLEMLREEQDTDDDDPGDVQP